MKYIKILHTTLGIIPFIWFVLFLTILTIGAIHLGEIPKHGNHIDPYAWGLDKVSFLEAFFYFLSFLSFILWIILTVVIFIFFKYKIVLNRLSIILFAIGVGGFFILYFGFTQVFLWVID